MKYRKKIIIEAEVYKEGMEDGFDYEKEDFTGEYRENVHFMGAKWQPKKKPYINTLEGKMYISKGDYIITGVKGERYSCKADIFDMTYELVCPECGSDEVYYENPKTGYGGYACCDCGYEYPRDDKDEM